MRVTATEAMTGFFIVPGLVPFSRQYPKIQTHLRNPVSLLNFYENQCDVMVGFGPLPHAELASRPTGFLHLIAVASRAYIAEHGMPTRETLGAHRFIDADYYASQTPTFASWRDTMAMAGSAHHCDNPFAYGLMVKAGLGIGLLGSFILADTDLVPLEMGIHVKLPIYIHAEAERLKSMPVRIVYDWLVDVFGPRQPVFAAELTLDAPLRDLVPRWFHHLTLQAEPAPPPRH